MKLDDFFNLSLTFKVGEYTFKPVFTSVNRGFDSFSLFHDVSFFFVRDGSSISESVALSELSLSELLEIYNHTYEIANKLEYKKLFIPFPTKKIFLLTFSSCFDKLFSKDNCIKFDYLDFKFDLLGKESSTIDLLTVKFNVSFVVNDLPSSVFNCDTLKKAFAINLSRKCFHHYYYNEKEIIFNYLNLIGSGNNFAVIDGVDNIDQLNFCRCKNVLVRGYFPEFIKSFSFITDEF